MIKWVVRLAFITGLLGLAGTIVILSTMGTKGEGEKRSSYENAPKTSLLGLKSRGPAPKYATESTVAPTKSKPLSVIQPELSSEHNLVSSKEVKQNKLKLTDASIASEKATEKETQLIKAENEEENQKDVGEKLFTLEELQQLVVRINTAKEDNGIYSNCVQIHSTKQGNNKNILSQIETYLRSERFAIAGREIVSKKIKGIQVTPNGECIKITIGTF